jgi:glycosyltransferase involved in cell wall biosynthesis
VSASASTSVVIAAYNAEAFIAEALDSVAAQTRPVGEVIVVDDGSTDATSAVVARFGHVRLIRQSNAGPAAARNAGLAVATGEYVALLDADDTWPAPRQAIMAGHLDTHAETMLVIGRQRVRIEPGAARPHWLPAGDPETWAPDQLPRPTGSVLFRRELLGHIGGFDPTMRHGEDTDWMLRARDAGFGVDLIDDIVLTRRIHGANLTMDGSAQHRALFEVLQRRMARRRQP